MKGGRMERRYVKLFGLLIALFIIMACSSLGSGSGEKDVPVEETASNAEGDGASESTAVAPIEESSLCANEYYPVVNGATWSYHGTSSETEDFAYTNTISSVRDDGFTVTVEFDEVTLVQEWACTPDGILALDSGGGTTGTLTTSDINLEMATQNASGITYPKEILPGDTWNHSLDYTGTMDFGGETADLNGYTEFNYTAIGIESVSVSSGTFDAMKVAIVTTININVTAQGKEVPVTYTSTSTSWFAHGVGWLKTDSMSDLFGTTSTEVVELVSYSIP
jgi:hypothetical protein